MNQMKVDVLLGLQWGDEGKGKVVDVLTPKYDAVARFQGGPNAGHTLEFGGERYILRSIPSGIFQGGKTNIIGNGVVIDPLLFKEEAEALANHGHNLKQQLMISKKAHLIMPTHRILDLANEAAKGSGKIGTTGKGIGPTYTDKISRNGLRVGDLLENFDEKYSAAKRRHENMLRAMNFEYNLIDIERPWLEALDYLKGFRLVDSEHEVNAMLREGRSVLAEGAQGYDVGHRFRFLSLRHFLKYDLRWMLHRPGSLAAKYWRSVRHLQSLLHTRGQWAIPYGVAR